MNTVMAVKLASGEAPFLAGRFFLCDTLGCGGMGIVRLAFDIESFQFVAVKSLFRELAALDDYRLRFSRERTIYEKLHHPHVVNLVGSFHEDDNEYIVLGFVAGESLEDFVVGRRPRLSVNRVLRYMEDLADALDTIHSKGIVHRDIKPQNLIIDQDGCIKLIDFGVAAADDGLLQTRSGIMVGTCCYASPEQNQGQGVGPESDLWSMGVTFWELLTCRRLFVARGAAAPAMVIVNQLQGDPEPPSKYNDEVPSELDALFADLLKADRQERLSSAGLLRDRCSAIRRDLMKSREASADDIRFECAHIALHRMMDGDLNGAEAALADAPGGKEDALVQFLLGKLAWRRRFKFRALDYVRRAVALAPDELLYRADLARILLSFNMYNQAARVIGEAERLGRESMLTRALGRLLEQGRKHLSEMRVGSPSPPRRVYDVEEERIRRTEAAVATAMRLSSGSGRMEALVAEGAYAEAVKAWEGLASGERDSPAVAVLASRALLGRGTGFLDQARFDDAFGDFEKALETAPDGDGTAFVLDTVLPAICAHVTRLREGGNLDGAVDFAGRWFDLLRDRGLEPGALADSLGTLLLEKGRKALARAEDLVCEAVGDGSPAGNAAELAGDLIDGAYDALARARSLGVPGVEPHLACAGSVRAELRFDLLGKLKPRFRDMLARAGRAFRESDWDGAIEILEALVDGVVVGRPHVIDRMLVDAIAARERSRVESALLDFHEGIFDRGRLREILQVARKALDDTESMDRSNLLLEEARARFDEIEEQTGAALSGEVLELVERADRAAALSRWDEEIRCLLDAIERGGAERVPPFLKRRLAEALTNRAEDASVRADSVDPSEARVLLSSAIEDLSDAAFFAGDTTVIVKARQRVQCQISHLDTDSSESEA